MGITGERDQVDKNARGVVSSVRSANKDQNVAVGIGISTSEQASQVNEYSDGAIVGSVFVKAYQQGGIEALRIKVREIVSGLKK
jgi:tryptophan synthase alpha chain